MAVTKTAAVKTDIEKKKCITPEARLSYPALFEPKSFNGQDPKYSAVLLFDKKKSDIAVLKKAALNAIVEKWGPNKTDWPKNLRMPFRDGDERSDTAGYQGTTYISASSKIQPGLVNQSLRPILNPQELYAGCYVRAELIAFAYDTAGNLGVSFSLQNVQKMRDGEKFGGRKDASTVFEAIADSSDDAASYSFDDDDTSADSLGF